MERWPPGSSSAPTGSTTHLIKVDEEEVDALGWSGDHQALPQLLQGVPPT